MKNTVKELLEKGIAELGFSFNEDIVNKYLRYLSELKRWNKRYNLTGTKEDREIVIKHFLDSLLYAKVLPENTKKIADIGTGAGFPGIPIKIILPHLELYLIEPSSKKITFLEHIINILKIDNIKTFEKCISDIKEGELIVDVAMTRALFKIKEFIKNSMHIIKSGGALIISKGPKYIEEIKNINDYTFDIKTFALPLSDIRRNLIIIRKRNYH